MSKTDGGADFFDQINEAEVSDFQEAQILTLENAQLTSWDFNLERSFYGSKCCESASTSSWFIDGNSRASTTIFFFFPFLIPSLCCQASHSQHQTY
ncbi:hypothetical protein Peur_047519 [Populus x canadensis]